mmetsp:Transcript_82488/g.237179  ORF Transcript_82488/g.237179 Transcript_82488/m.237179 type:complete len:134 (-) Transcript_82488:691-1092(-)
MCWRCMPVVRPCHRYAIFRASARALGVTVRVDLVPPREAAAPGPRCAKWCRHQRTPKPRQPRRGRACRACLFASAGPAGAQAAQAACRQRSSTELQNLSAPMSLGPMPGMLPVDIVRSFSAHREPGERVIQSS